METYVVELEGTELDSFALTVPALPGLLILGKSIDEVLERAQAAIAFLLRTHKVGRGAPKSRSRLVLASSCPKRTSHTGPRASVVGW